MPPKIKGKRTRQQLVNAYSHGERTDETRAAWRVYRREKERERWARLRAETGLSNREIRIMRACERDGVPYVPLEERQLEAARQLLREAGEL